MTSLPRCVPTNRWQDAARILLGVFMLGAAMGHLFFARETFSAQVPAWVPLADDLVIVLSGGVELAFGLTLLAWARYRVWVGVALAVFFVLIFPGNIAQYRREIDAFGLDSDAKRLARLFFQPVLILWALWCCGALQALQRHARSTSPR